MVTYSKLNDGTWGIRSETQLVKGDIAVVTTKAGRTHTVEITGIVWNNGKVWLARCNRVNIPASLAVAMLSSQSRRIMMELEQGK